MSFVGDERLLDAQVRQERVRDGYLGVELVTWFMSGLSSLLS